VRKQRRGAFRAIARGKHDGGRYPSNEIGYASRTTMRARPDRCVKLGHGPT
jgi:hypothetical protein